MNFSVPPRSPQSNNHGVAFRQTYDPRGDDAQEPEGPEQSDAGSGQRKDENGATREKGMNFQGTPLSTEMLINRYPRPPQVIADIKKLAKEGQMDAVKIMAKDLVRTRRYVKKFMLMKANIQAVSLKIQTLKSQSTMAQAMKGVTQAMTSMNRQMNMPQIQKILMDFEKQSEIMDMKEEMINDVMDDAMEGEGDEEETDAVVAQVLDELGLQLGDQLSGLPQVRDYKAG